MAVQRISQSSAFALKYKETDEQGKEKTITRKYANIKTEALDADVYAVALGVANLQKGALDAIDRIDENKLVNA